MATKKEKPAFFKKKEKDEKKEEKGKKGKAPFPKGKKK